MPPWTASPTSPDSPVEPSAVSLRRPRPDDETFLVALFRSFRNDIDRAVGLSDSEKDTFVRQQYDAQKRSYASRFPNAEHRIVTVDDARAGRIWVDYRKDQIRLLDLMIAPPYQGRGVGSHLLRDLQDEARRQQLPLRHMVHTDNVDAQRFYRRLGFTFSVSPVPSHHAMVWHPEEG